MCGIHKHFVSRFCVQCLLVSILIAATTTAIAEDGPRGTGGAAPATVEPWYATYLPSETIGVVEISFPSLASKAESRPVYEAISSNAGFVSQYGLSATKLADFVVFVRAGANQQIGEGAILRSKTVIDRQALRESLGSKTEVLRFRDTEYLLTPRGRAIRFLDERTLLQGDEQAIKQSLETVASDGKLTSSWSIMNSFPGVDFRFAANVAKVKDLKQSGINSVIGLPESISDNVTMAAAAIHIDKELQISAIIEARDEKFAKGIQKNFEDALSQDVNKLFKDLPVGGQVISDKIAPHAGELLKSARVVCKKHRVGLQLKCSFSVEKCRQLATMPVQFNSEDVQTQRSAHNLHALYVGLQKYHAQHGRLPPPVLLSPDGRTRHSWRVAILPFIEREELFQKYRLNEPWDSEHNRQLLPLAPNCMRSPIAPPDSVNTSYFALVGKGTAFGDSKGISIDETPGRLRQTVILIETNRDIPWTKPDDIEFTLNAELPRLGGIHPKLFWTVFGDGALRGFPLDFAPEKLRAAFTANPDD